MTTDSLAPIVVVPALEPPDGQPSARIMAKGLAASLARSLFCGEIVIFRNRDTPVFRVERKGIQEITVRPALPRSLEDVSGVGNDYLLFSLAEFLQPHPRQWVIIADSASVALRNIDHLIPADGKGAFARKEADVYWSDAGNGSGAAWGLFAARGECLSHVLKAWKEAKHHAPEAATSSAVWQSVLEGLPFEKRRFERGEVAIPSIDAVDWSGVCGSAFVTVAGWPEIEKQKFLQALYLGNYLGDQTGMIFDLIDA